MTDPRDNGNRVDGIGCLSLVNCPLFAVFAGDALAKDPAGVHIFPRDTPAPRLFAATGHEKSAPQDRASDGRPHRRYVY